jgi:integrase
LNSGVVCGEPEEFWRVARSEGSVGRDHYVDGVSINSEAAPDYEDWLTSLRLAGRSPKTVYGYDLTVRAYLESYPKKAVDDFATSDCKRFLSRYPPGSVGARYAALLSFFDHLYVVRRVIQTNPMHHVERPKKPPTRPPEDYTDDEKAALCNLDCPDGPLLVLMFECGLRKGECRALRRRDIHLDSGEVRLSGRRKKAWLTRRAHEAVQELDAALGLSDRDHLWGTRPGGGNKIRRRDAISETSFYMWWSKCVQKAGVRFLKPDTTRLGYQRLQESGEGFAGAEALQALARTVTDEVARGFIEEAILCLRTGALRAGIVFLWSGAIRTLHEKALKLGPSVVNAAIRKQDSKARTVAQIEDFAWIRDRTFLDSAPDLGLLDKGQKTALLAALDLRNHCGHPSKYVPRDAKTRSYIEDIVGIVFK